MTDPRGKTAIVTGGGSGSGEGVAATLARQGMNVVIRCRREAALARVAGAIAAEGGAALPVAADVSQEADVARVIEAAVSAYGAIHLLANNAGISGGGPIHDHDVGEWDRIIAINLRGPFLMARAVLPLMRRQREGHIVNISSESGLVLWLVTRRANVKLGRPLLIQTMLNPWEAS